MTPLIDDETATRFYNEIDNAPEEDRQQMADALLAWGEEKQSREREETDTHFSKLFTDESYYQQINDNDPALSEALDPEATAKRASIHAYLEHQLNRPIDAANFEPERDAFAMQAFGQKNLNDGQLFDFIRGDYDWQKQRTEAINDLQMQSVGKAIADSQLGQTRPFVDGMTEVFNQWQQKYPELVDGKNDAAFLSQGYKLYYDTINDLDTVRPQASKALSTLTSFTQGNATDEDMQSLANDFVGAPPEDRQKIYKYVTLAAQAGQIDRAGIEQFAINMGQAFTRGFDFVPQGTLQIQEAGVNDVLQKVKSGQKVLVPQNGDITKATVAEQTPKAQVLGQAPTVGMFATPQDGYREATPEEADQFTSYATNAMESFKVVRELRNVAKTGVDPIRPVLEEKSFWGTAERGAYGLSGSIPLMGATAVNPYLGVLAYQATEYDRIMLENPEINPQFAQGLALVEGAANAAIDRVQLSSLTGRLPMFGRYLDRIASNGVRRTVKIGANVVEQNLQEGAQDLIAPVLETAVAALREDMPDKDFGKLLNEWGGQRAETFFATLPLALIGGGVATYRDIKNPSAELNATKLRMAGFGQDQVTFIQRAENPEEYTARIQMEWDKRTPEAIEAGRQEVIAEMQQAATPGENDAKLSETVAEDGTRRWVVTAPDGKELLQTQDQQAALDAVRQHTETQLLNKQFETAYEPQELRQIINDRITNWKSQDSNNTLVMESEGMNAQQKLEQLQAAGNASQIQELHNRIANSHLKDTPYEQINILGEASVDDVSEMVFKSLITINPNTRPENLREEIHHTAVKVAIRNGSVTLDTLRGWLDATEKALPGTFQNLVRDSEGDIVESLAQVQAAYEDGKIDANEASALPASFIDYIKNMMRTFAEVLRRAVALRGAFKDGALPAEYESFLAESVGLNQQTMVDTTRERVGGELAQGTFNYSVGQRVSTDTNPYPMEQKGKWWANEDFAQRGGQIVTMSPDEFLSQVRPLEVDEASRDNIDDLKNMMQSGRKLDPLAIYADGKEDGRHRATAAKELGMATIPVLDFRANKPEPKGNDFSIGSRASAVSTDTPSIRASNATITGPANYSIGAFHGTPHKVDKFSTEKIGTGEGAQAYGWGLYFAQAKAVGEGYRDQLGGIRLMTADGQMADNIVSTPGAKKILKEARAFWKQTKSLDGFVKQLESSKSQSKVWAAQGDNVESNSQYVKDVDEVLSAIKDTTPTPTGNLYSVELDVDDADLLDWDKPLSDQSPKVHAALQSISGNWLWQDAISGKSGEQVGGALYSTLRATFPDAEFSRDGVDASKKASEALLAAGIPGIRYLDGGSRSVNATDDRLLELAEKNNGNKEAAVDEFMRSVYDTPKAKEKMRSDLLRNFPERTSNYVVFDENLIKITEENGNRIPASEALAAPATGATNYSIGKKDKEVVVNPDETTEPGTPAPDTGIEILDPDQEGEDIPWGPTNYSIGPRSLPEVFPTIDKKLFNKIKKETSTIAAIHIDRMKVGELMGIPLQGGMFYPSIVENLKAGVVWAFNAPNVARTVARRAAANGGYVKLVLMQEGNVIGNKTFTHVWFASLEQNISSGAITKATALGELNRVRELFSNHSDSKLSTGHKKKWKSLEEAKNAIISLPQQKRASTYFKKTKVETKGEGVKIAYQQLLSKKNTKLGMPDPITLVEQMEEPAFKGMPTGAIVGIIKIDPIKDSDPILTGQQAGVPTHLSYDYVLKGKPVAKMKKITVLDEAFPETKNQILTQQHTDFPLAGAINYSIASQREIDRVNAALGGMNRGPDERLKVYERAKQKFSKLMSWNSDELGAMADTGSDETQIRRNQLLQGFGELDAILQVLPPEVRGRVGGYTVLANIAPMDVFKDGVKVSEAKNMDGAIISAWMKEGQNIGQAGKQVSLPPGYTAKENLASKRADKALADFFRDRIKKIDTELEKVLVREYTEAITKAVKQSRPKAGDNGVRKSTLGAETQKFADMVYRATLLDDEATPKRMDEIDAALTNPDATAEDISALSEELSILNTFGDLDNRSSETLAQGLDWLKGQLQMGREAWRIKEQARIDEQRARAAATIEWLGKGTAKKRFADKGLMQRITEVGNNYLLDHASFEQFVTAMLPPEIAANFSVRLRKADMAAQSAEIRDGKGILDAVREGAKAANMSAGDAMLWLKGDQKNAVAYLEGRKVKDERIAIELAQKIVTGEADRSKLTDADIETLRNELAALPADTQKEFVTIKRVIFRGEDVKLDMSRAKAIQLLLSWNQPDVQIKMRKEGWTDESAADLKALVNDPVSRSVINYLQALYGKGVSIVNPVYSRIFGMTMPQVKNYAPTRFLNAKDSKDIGLDGSPTATGTTPSFAKTRVTHSAKIAAEDALTVAQGHIAQQAHWVHFAELAREFRALLSSPDVRESLKQKHGDAVLKSAELWADQLEQRGGNKARESAWLNNVIGTAISGKAVASLGFNLKTLAMQLENTIRFGLSLDMKQIASALSQPGNIIEDIQTVWESDAIQNRLQGGATAEARFLFSRYAGKPNFAAKIAEASMTPINWLDSAGTSISSAIVYRANLDDALDAGMPENLAKQAALNAASEAIYRFAQPVSFGQKSIMENNGNVFAKTFFLFMSDPRLKTAILADAARGLATGRGKASEHIRRIVAVELMALVSHVISSAFKDTFSDDDDEEIWGIGGFAKAMLLAPFQGFFFAGSVAEVALSKLTGQGYFTSSQNPLLNTAESAIRAGSNLDDAFNFSDPDAMLKEWNNIFRSMAVTPTMAAPAVLLNMVKPALGLYQNATTED